VFNKEISRTDKHFAARYLFSITRFFVLLGCLGVLCLPQIVVAQNRGYNVVVSVGQVENAVEYFKKEWLKESVSTSNSH